MIKLVGVEFEGAWRGERGISPFNDDTIIKYDGSVRPCIDPLTGLNFVHYGEAVSPPLPPAEILKWAEEHCPHGVNTSMGTHVHVSFASIGDYSAMISREFFDRIYGRLEFFSNLIERDDPEFARQLRVRLEGGNNFCKKQFGGLNHVLGRGDRYQGLNYCWRTHTTLEFRILPGVQNPSTAVKSINLLLRETTDFLSRRGFKKKYRFRR